MPGRSITDAIFIVHQLQETTHAINKTLNTAFVDPGVSSGAAHTEHAWNCKKQSPCWLQPEWRVQCESGCSPRILPETLLLVVVLEALSQDFPTECPWENLYADDLVIISESLEESQEKLILKKTNMGWKGLWVNMDKTKVLISGPGIDVLQKSEKTLYCMSQGRRHKLRFLCWLFQLGPQEMQGYIWSSEASLIPASSVNGVLGRPGHRWQTNDSGHIG